MTLCTNPDVITRLVLPIISTSIALMVFLLALFWMAAQFFKRQEYESFVSIEVYQLFVSLIMLGTVFGASCFTAEMANGFSGRGDQFEVGREYLDYLTNRVIMPNVIELEYLKLQSQYFGDIKMRWGPDVWGVAAPAFPGAILIERVTDFLLLFLSPFLSSLMVQMVVLEFVRGVALPFVLPAGVVLRVFPPTRDAGAFLIATSMGFGIVFPFSYVMHDNIVRTMISLPDSSLDYQQALQRAGAGNVEKFMTDNGVLDLKYRFWRPFEYMSYLLLQALFLPALSITLTVAFIKGTTKFISQKLG